MKRALLTLVLALAATPAVALEKPRDWVPPPASQVPNFREDWRSVVVELANYGKTRKKDFVVLVHGGVELVVKGDREAQWEDIRDPEGRFFEKRLPLGSVFRSYMKVVDGIILDGLYCGDDAFGKPLDQAIKERRDLDKTLAEEKAKGIQRAPVPSAFGPYSIDPQEELRRSVEIRRNVEREERQRRMVYAIDAMKQEGRRVMSLEACKTQKDVDAAYKGADRDRVLSYATVGASSFNTVPRGNVNAENAAQVDSVGRARNWLPVLRGDGYASKADWVAALEHSNHDVLVVDVAFRGTESLTKADVAKLKYKQLGSPRKVLAVLPVGRAYDWRWYWRKGWEAGNPPFLFAPDPDAPGAYVTSLADPQWKEMLGKYIVGIVDLGFDGVVLDDLDTYRWFEELMPLDG